MCQGESKTATVHLHDIERESRFDATVQRPCTVVETLSLVENPEYQMSYSIVVCYNTV